MLSAARHRSAAWRRLRRHNTHGLKLRQQQELIDQQAQPAAPASRMTSDTELHAAYCLEYLKEKLTLSCLT